MPEPTDLDVSESLGAIEKLSYHATNENWFEYPIIVHPHHTDYGGVVWHGAYITWLEEARVQCLSSIGINFADLVAAGCDMPVIEMSLRYHRALRMGESAVVKTKMRNLDSVRIHWDYEIQSTDRETLHLSGLVSLVAVDLEKGKIMRKLPANVKDALMRLGQS
jgi:acyl-CoA thioester hydrolase